MAHTDEQVRTYGGWRRSRGMGLMGLGSGQTLVVLIALTTLIISVSLGPTALAIVIVPALLIIGATVLRWDGVPLLHGLMQRVRWGWGSARGYTSYRSGVTAAHAQAWRLPGLLAPTTLLTVQDPAGDHGLVWHRRVGTMTATLRAAATSTWLVDREQATTWVSNWGGWLSSLGYLPIVRWVSITVDTAPAAGSRLADYVTGRIAPNAPASARRVLTQLVDSSPAAAADVETRVSITFDPAYSPTRPRDLNECVAEISRILPGLQDSLGSCGLTVLGRASAHDLVATVRTAYDPLARGDLARLIGSRDSAAVHRYLDWDSAGPVAAEEHYDHYQHDSGWSVSWAWHEAPRANVHADVLARLLAPGPYPKRVSLIYRPFAAGEAARIVEREVNAAAFRDALRAAQKRDENARDRADKERARGAAREEAAGAGVGLMSMFVTVTVTDKSELGRAIADIESRGGRQDPAASVVGQPVGRFRNHPAVRYLPPAAGPAVAALSTKESTMSMRGKHATQPTAAAEASAPSWGWRIPGAGRVSHLAPGMQYQGTTVQLCGLYPYVAGSGSPMLGVPIGRHMLWGEVLCLDPLEWLRSGLVTNPGMFLLGQPGVGKSSLAKRLITGLVGYGTQALVLGDTKPDYTPLVRALGGQVIEVGRGMDRINPLDSGPLGQIVTRMSGPDAERLRLEIRGRRLSLLLALCTLIRNGRVTNPEEVILGRSVDILTDRLPREPTVPDVLTLLEEGPDQLRAAARAGSGEDYQRRVDELIATLALLCEGSLKGVFDAATTTPIDLDAPAVSVDISHVAAAGDQLVAAAMLSTWAYAFGVVDAAAVLADQGLAPRRQFLAVMDELWRALRGAPGLVDHADALTRLNRQRGMGSLMITHSLDDLDALPTEEDRAKARGFFERAAIKIMAALPGRELDRINQITRLSGPEREMVSSWAAPEALFPGSVHPGRGKYLVKTGERPGLPVALSLVGEEWRLYDTDMAVRGAA